MQALNRFRQEDAELCLKLRLVASTCDGYQFVNSIAGKYTRLKASIDNSRYFIVQISKQGDAGLSSKRSPAIRFGDNDGY